MNGSEHGVHFPVTHAGTAGQWRQLLECASRLALWELAESGRSLFDRSGAMHFAPSVRCARGLAHSKTLRRSRQSLGQKFMTRSEGFPYFRHTAFLRARIRRPEELSRAEELYSRRDPRFQKLIAE